ncbi:MAG TPA: CoA ester lyase [Pseudolysinimonas sp.]|nr:CoA ester lyase [Pseudolysinimonas sp.]
MSFDLGPALLFCPADRPERYEKALAAADAVILDLEDAVAPANRPAARAALGASGLDPARVIVRINELGSPDAEADLDALRGTAYRTIMVPKAGPDLVVPEGFEVIALCESAAGVVAAPQLATRAIALMWGAEDLIASLGGTSSRRADGGYRDVARTARTTVLLAAAAAGIPAIDTVHLDIADLEGLRAEAEDAAASGFAATACIHPSHAPVIRAAYAPTADQVDWARRVLAAAAENGGVFRLDGAMVDGPVLRHAEAVLRRAAPGAEGAISPRG